MVNSDMLKIVISPNLHEKSAILIWSNSWQGNKNSKVWTSKWCRALYLKVLQPHLDKRLFSYDEQRNSSNTASGKLFQWCHPIL